MSVGSQRVSYGEALLRLGAEDRRIVVLEADLCKSTMGILFEQQYPDRFFEMGIAEANMAGVAAGLALTGYIPFMATFAVFATGRCYDQIRTGICIPSLNVKICGSSAGLSDFGDGSTHQTVEDISIMRTLPNMRVFSPADAAQTEQIMEYMAAHEGPMYLRVNRSDLPHLYTKTGRFVPGAIDMLKEGTDGCCFATGIMVSKAMEAAQILSEAGISLRVVNVPSIKPLDETAVREACCGMQFILTAEEHSTIGGLGSAVLERIAGIAHGPVTLIGIEDKFGTSAESYDILMQGYGLTAKRIAEAARMAIRSER